MTTVSSTLSAPSVTRAPTQYEGWGLHHQADFFLRLLASISHFNSMIRHHAQQFREPGLVQGCDTLIVDQIATPLTNSYFLLQHNSLFAGPDVVAELNGDVLGVCKQFQELVDSVGCQTAPATVKARAYLMQYARWFMEEGKPDLIPSQVFKGEDTQWKELGAALPYYTPSLSLLARTVRGMWEYHIETTNNHWNQMVSATADGLIDAQHRLQEARSAMERCTSSTLSYFFEAMRHLHNIQAQWLSLVHKYMVLNGPKTEELPPQGIILMRHVNTLCGMVGGWLKALYLLGNEWTFRLAFEQKLIQTVHVDHLIKRVIKHLPLLTSLYQNLRTFASHPNKTTATLATRELHWIKRYVQSIVILKRGELDHRPLNERWRLCLLIQSMASPPASFWKSVTKEFQEDGGDRQLMATLAQFASLKTMTVRVIDSKTFDTLRKIARGEELQAERELLAYRPQRRSINRPKHFTEEGIESKSVPEPLEPPPPPVLSLPRKIPEQSLSYHLRVLSTEKIHTQIKDYEAAARHGAKISLQQLQSLCEISRSAAWTPLRARMAVDQARRLMESLLDLALCHCLPAGPADHVIQMSVGDKPLHTSHDLALLAAPLASLADRHGDLAPFKDPIIHYLRKANTVLWYETAPPEESDPFGVEWHRTFLQLHSSEPQDHAAAEEWIDRVIISPTLEWANQVIPLLKDPAIQCGTIDHCDLTEAVEQAFMKQGQPHTPLPTKREQTTFRNALSAHPSPTPVIDHIVDSKSAGAALLFIQAMLDLAGMSPHIGDRGQRSAREHLLASQFIHRTHLRCQEVCSALQDKSYLQTPNAYPDLLALSARLLIDLYKALLLHLPLYVGDVHIVYMTSLEDTPIDRTTLLNTTDLALLSKTLSEWQKFGRPPHPHIEPVPALPGTLWAKLRRVMCSPLHYQHRRNKGYHGCEDLFAILETANSMSSLSEGFSDDGFQKVGTSHQQYETKLKRMQDLAEPLLWQMLNTAQTIVHRVLGRAL